MSDAKVSPCNSIIIMTTDVVVFQKLLPLPSFSAVVHDSENYPRVDGYVCELF